MATTATAPEDKAIGRRELVVMVALLMSLNALAIDGMLPALDEIAAEFGVLAGNDRQLIVAVYLLATGIGSLVPGAFADRYGRRIVLIWTLVAFTILSASIVLVASFETMVVLRALSGLVGAGLMVVPVAIIRDQYEGDRMARLMSLVSAVFITVPVVAPSLGQAVLLIAGWRWIFVLLATMSLAAAMWVYFRLPETLHREFRQEIEIKAIVRNMGVALMNRSAFGYVVGSALLIGSMFGYVNSAQQLIGEHFGADEMFPVIFGATAAMLVVSNLVNSRIVERFGARRVSHAGVLLFIVASMAQLWAAYYRDSSLAWFIPLMALNVMLLGFLGANFSSIAMQPFARIAGAASSLQTFIRMFGAAVVGLVIGQSYDGTARPFAYALLIGSVVALVAVLFSEKGKLFRRKYRPPPVEDEF